MGLIGNTAKNACYLVQMKAQQKYGINLAKKICDKIPKGLLCNAKKNIVEGSEKAPIVGDVKDIGEGLATSNF